MSGAAAFSPDESWYVVELAAGAAGEAGALGAANALEAAAGSATTAPAIARMRPALRVSGRTTRSG
jgi:hypothetical protein